MKSNIIFYVKLIDDFLKGRIPIDILIRVFLYVSKRDNELTKKEEEIILKLFWAIEDYVPYPEIREEGDLDEEDLLRVAKEVLEELKKIAEE